MDGVMNNPAAGDGGGAGADRQDTPPLPSVPDLGSTGVGDHHTPSPSGVLSAQGTPPTLRITRPPVSVGGVTGGRISRRRGGGRGRGSRARGGRGGEGGGRGNEYSAKETEILLDLLEKYEPIGSVEWEHVQCLHNNRFPNMDRTVESIRRKFSEL